MCLLGAMAEGQSSRPDSAFDTIQFGEWLNHADDAHIDWSMRVWPPYLSENQRLETSITALVDIREFVKRPEPGQMVLFIEIRDRDNQVYRSHRPLGLSNKDRLDDLKDIKLGEHLCIMPGEYDVAAAVYDTKSHEHSLKRAKLRIPDLPRDPLDGAWSGLPRVELSRRCDSKTASRLNLTMKTQKPILVDVIVTRTANPLAASDLSPRLDVLSQISSPNGTVRVTAPDIDRGKVSSQSLHPELNQRRLWAGLPPSNPKVIDARAAQNYKEAPKFFVSEIRKLVESTEAAGAEHVLIILSEPRKFPTDADLRPIQATSDPGIRVFYIRCNWRTFTYMPAQSLPPGPQDWSTPPELPRSLPTPPRPPNNSDSLAKTLGPLHPRLFDVVTAADFRHALGEILNEISR
jgi:hypothetical protein